jgi:hypothetical protein
MNKKEYWKMLDRSTECDIIWGTNDIAKEGLDISDLNTMILLNGGQDVEQAAGRILRKLHTDVPPTIIDMVYKCGNFPKHMNVRRNYYDEENYIMHKHIIELDDINSAYKASDKLEKFIERYPEEGDPGTIKPTQCMKKKEIPLANHPPELAPIKVHDHNEKIPLNIGFKKKNNEIKEAIPIECPPPRRRYAEDEDKNKDKEGTCWMGYDSDDEGIHRLDRGNKKGRLYLDESSNENDKHSTLKEINKESVKESVKELVKESVKEKDILINRKLNKTKSPISSNFYSKAPSIPIENHSRYLGTIKKKNIKKKIILD